MNIDMINYLLVELLAWAFVIALVFPKSIPAMGKGFGYFFKLLGKLIEWTLKILAEALKLVLHLLKQVLLLIQSLFQRR